MKQPDPSLTYAAQQAERFLSSLESIHTPAEARDTLAKVITGAMIKEHDVAKKYMCPKCQASYSAYRKRQGGAS